MKNSDIKKEDHKIQREIYEEIQRRWLAAKPKGCDIEGKVIITSTVKGGHNFKAEDWFKDK